jgi:hypothetical protein
MRAPHISTTAFATDALSGVEFTGHQLNAFCQEI